MGLSRCKLITPAIIFHYLIFAILLKCWLRSKRKSNRSHLLVDKDICSVKKEQKDQHDRSDIKKAEGKFGVAPQRTWVRNVS